MQTLERDLQQQGGDLLSPVLGASKHPRMPWWAWASASLPGGQLLTRGVVSTICNVHEEVMLPAFLYK